jgi:hypothetical protein
MSNEIYSLAVTTILHCTAIITPEPRRSVSSNFPIKSMETVAYHIIYGDSSNSDKLGQAKALKRASGRSRELLLNHLN